MILINISELPWVPERMRRNQAIFIHLLRSASYLQQGLFINPPIVERKRLCDYVAVPQLQSVLQSSENGKSLTVLQPIYRSACSGRHGVIQLSTELLCLSLRSKYIRRSQYILHINSADEFEYQIARTLGRGAALRSFDLSDDFLSFRHLDPPAFAERLRALLRSAEKVLCVNDHVAAKTVHEHKRVFHNCTDYEHFRSSTVSFGGIPHYPKPAGAVYIGFIGGIIDARIDFQLLEALFNRFPQYKFLFVGYTNSSMLLDRLATFPNTAYIPEVPYSRLPCMIKGFDVAIVPHLDNEHTRGNDLLKVLDYFASGVPVVSTRCSNIEKYGSAVYIASSPSDFGDQIERLVCNKKTFDPSIGFDIAAAQSWSKRVPELVPWLDPTGAGNTN